MVIANCILNYIVIDIIFLLYNDDHEQEIFTHVNSNAFSFTQLDLNFLAFTHFRVEIGLV